MSMPKSEWDFLFAYAIESMFSNWCDPCVDNYVLWTFQSKANRHILQLGKQYGLFEEIHWKDIENPGLYSDIMATGFKLTKHGEEFMEKFHKEFHK